MRTHVGNLRTPICFQKHEKSAEKVSLQRENETDTVISMDKSQTGCGKLREKKKAAVLDTNAFQTLILGNCESSGTLSLELMKSLLWFKLAQLS